VADVAVAALPFNVAVIIPATNAPFTSLATMAFAVFALVAVVAAFETLPLVLIVASLLSAISAVAAKLSLVILVIVFDPASIVFETNVSVPAKVAIVPVVGKTKFVAAVVLKVMSEAF
jgi:hypothetical protein